MHRVLKPPPPLPLAGILALLLARIAAAQTSLGLEAAPLVVHSLGLSINPPLGSNVQVDTSTEPAGIAILDRSEVPAWRIRIQELPTTPPGATPAEIAVEHVQRMHEVELEITLLDEQSFRCGDREGYLIYLRRAAGEGRYAVLGYLYLPSGPRRHLLAAVLTTPEDLARVRPVMDACFASIRLTTATKRSEQWRDLTTKGRTFLNSLTPERLQSAVGLSQCLRIYRSDDLTGDTEIGWSVVTTHAATSEAVGAADPTDPEYTSGPDLGLLVAIRGRMAVQPDRRIYQDFVIRYWMAWDQAEERWNVRATVRQAQASRGESEIGVRYRPSTLRDPTARDPKTGAHQRIGTHPQMLTVIQSSEATRSREPYEWPVPDAYLSQALGWLIGRLMPRDSAESVTYAYYFYNNRGVKPELALRTDKWEPAADGSGHYRMTTHLGVDSPPILSRYDHNGSLLRQTREDGSVVEPIDPDLLKRLWKSKGLDPGGGS